MCAMELRKVHARSGDRPQEADEPPRDATRANDAREAEDVAPENGHARRAQVVESGADQAGTAPRSAGERERPAVPTDANRLPAPPPTRDDLGRHRLPQPLERLEIT